MIDAGRGRAAPETIFSEIADGEAAGRALLTRLRSARKSADLSLTPDALATLLTPP